MAKSKATESARTTKTAAPATAEALLRAWPRTANVPSYIDGCESGRAAAMAFIKLAAEDADRDWVRVGLHHIAMGLFEQMRLAGCTARVTDDPNPLDPARSAVHGLAVGFFSEIERALQAARLQVAATDDKLAQRLATASAGGWHTAAMQLIERERQAAEAAAG